MSKPLTASFDDFSNGFEYLMPKVKKSGNEFVCIGDFNYNLLIASGDSLEFLNLMFALPSCYFAYKSDGEISDTN